MKDAHPEAAFTLIEVVIAAAVFVFVAAAGFETLRGLGASALQVEQRVQAAAAANTLIARLRSDALSSAAVWAPNAPCGDPAVAFMHREPTGLSFDLFVFRSGVMLASTAQNGPIDPCAATTTYGTALGGVTNVTLVALAASALTTLPDGALFAGPAIPAVALDSHVRDYDGAPILYGNGVVELTIDADPVATTVDLIAGNAPSGYTVNLTYACGGRCQANGSSSSAPFPEIRGLDYRTCTIAHPSLPDSNAYYVASSFGLDARGHIVVTQYTLQVQYTYQFAGGAAPALTIHRVGPAFTWPASNDLSDPYPVDYTSNALKANLATVIAGAPPSGLANDDAVCNAMSGETDYE